MSRFISSLTRTLRTDFVKVSSWSGVSTLVKMATGFISIKVVANLIGPSGIALVGQFMNVITMLGNLGTGCISQGVTKYIAENYDAPAKQNDIIKNAVRITLFSSILVSFFVVLFSTQLGVYIFKANSYRSIVILFGVSISFYAFNIILISILNGFKKYRKFIIINIVSNVTSLGITLLLVIYLGLYGALINCIAGQSMVIVVTLWFIRKEPWFRQIFPPASTDWKVIRKLSGFTLMALTSSLVVPYSQILIRSTVAKHISLDEAGIWEGMNRISSMYLMFITTSIGIFYLPRLSEIKENYALKQEIFKTMKIVLPLLALTSFTLFIARDLIIHVIFSDKFIGMRNLFGYQMIGDFFKMASWLVAFLFFAKAKVKQFIFSEIVASALFVLLAYEGVVHFGIRGTVYAYALTYFFYFLLCVYIFKYILFAKEPEQ